MNKKLNFETLLGHKKLSKSENLTSFNPPIFEKFVGFSSSKFNFFPAKAKGRKFFAAAAKKSNVKIFESKKNHFIEGNENFQTDQNPIRT